MRSRRTSSAWIGQFSQADGSETKNLVPEADRKTTIAGLEVLRVDLSGTYPRCSPRAAGSHGQGGRSRNYRTLAAIVVTPKLGNYFIKFYGPRPLVDDHAAEFNKMIAGLAVKKCRPMRDALPGSTECSNAVFAGITVARRVSEDAER